MPDLVPLVAASRFLAGLGLPAKEPQSVVGELALVAPGSRPM